MDMIRFKVTPHLNSVLRSAWSESAQRTLLRVMPEEVAPGLYEVPLIELTDSVVVSRKLLSELEYQALKRAALCALGLKKQRARVDYMRDTYEFYIQNLSRDERVFSPCRHKRAWNTLDGEAPRNPDAKRFVPKDQRTQDPPA